MFNRALIALLFAASFIETKKIPRERTPPPHSIAHLIGPKGVDEHDMMTCEEFSKNARFNPYSVLGDKWFTFYYFAPETSPFIVSFLVPTKKELQWIKALLDPQVEEPINWTAKVLVMKDESDNMTYLLTEEHDRGAYLIYHIVKYVDGEMLEPMDIRFKQTSDNKYLGLMKCEEEILYIMSRMNDIPPKKKIQDAAATMGYRSRGGRSYLYQGHQWMPIPEADDRAYWLSHEHDKRYMFDYIFD